MLSVLPRKCSDSLRTIVSLFGIQKKSCRHIEWKTLLRHVSSSPPDGYPAVSYKHHVGQQPLLYKTIGTCLQEAADTWPGRPWVTSCQEDVTLTFSQVLEQADQLAAGLLECGLRPGDRLGLCSYNSSRWIVVMMAAARAGLVLVAINPAYQESELEYCLEKVGVRALVIPSKHKSQDYSKMLLSILPQLKDNMAGLLRADKLPLLTTVITMDDAAVPGCFTFTKVMSMANTNSMRAISRLQSSIQPDDGCNIQFTSGTTGKPKAAYLSHYNYVNNGFLIGKRNNLSEAEKISVQVPLFHAFGVVIVTMASLQYGTSLVLTSASYNPEKTIKATIKEQCTILTGTPTMYVDLLHQQRLLNAQLPSVKLAVVGGAPCSPQLFNQMKKNLNVESVKSVFGMTETSAVIFQSLEDETMDQMTQTVGHVQEHTEAQVVDTEGKVVPLGTPGELWIRGYCNMLGYWGDSEKTLEMVGPSKWLKTGDQFVLESSGYGRVVGRLKDVIIRGGENVFPKEIEDFLNTHPDVVESQVFGVPDSRLGEEICAAVRVSDGSSLTLEALQHHCKGRLAGFKVPRMLRVVSTFPRTASGKIQKYRLKDMMERGEL